ncbi:cation-translocating P-type ATPase [Rhodococcus sp. IEGM 1379]|uniref:cation-translocating P-type ATPase n=1 Tax=Rhodococcus sp. IEGM 1379 TaxID=3047086 RepID=UPI0024B7F2F2|nr:cation-translocating P-type ATPase [Rhodococcus sp. IEGM 1379]
MLPSLVSNVVRAAPAGDLIARLFTTSVAAAGIVPALAGSLARVPLIPGSSLLAAGVAAMNYQPRLRKRIEQVIGRSLTDVVLESATSVADVLTQAPAALLVDVGVRSLRLDEAWNLGRASSEWGVAQCPASSDSEELEVKGLGERHADRVALGQLTAAGVIACVTGSSETAATAVRVASPRALRVSRESFSATLTRELWRREGSLVVNPGAVRKLDRVDTVLIDPRVLLAEKLRVADIRGVADADRVEVWNRARQKLGDGNLAAGRHSIDGAEVLVIPERKALAEAVVVQLHTAGVQAVGIDVDSLGSLRGGFDQLFPVSADIDDALESALTSLASTGANVAVVTASDLDGPAVVRIGVAEPGRAPPTADILDHGLAGVWRVLRALPAARTATRRGVELSSGASLLGALVMLPGVRGRGPGPVTVGAGAALWTGYRLARSALRVDVPAGSSRNDWHELGVEEVLSELPSNEATVRSSRSMEAVSFVLAPVRLAREALGAVRSELADPLTPVLATGSAASAILGSPIDAVLVGSVLAGNATLSAMQRLHSERVVRELLRVQEPLARRVPPRSDAAERVPAEELAVGDIVDIEPGDVVPVDCRLVRCESLEIDESSLTGESMPVEKHTRATPGVPVAERSCMVYAGTTVVAGAGQGKVTAVGSLTEARKVDVREPRVGPDVGLSSRLRELTKKTLPVSIGGGALVTAMGLLRGTALRQAVTGGVAVAVAAVPEGLPLVATLAQQAAARRLTSVGALVRSPRSIEALGRVDCVCFDKTGTLSENHLRVAAVERVDGWNGDRILEVAARSALASTGDQVFHSTDSAVVSAAEEVLKHPLVFEGAQASALVPFRSGRPYSAALIGRRIALKGSPEFVSASAAPKSVSAQHVRSMAERGLRVIAVAHRELSESDAQRAAQDSDFLEQCCASGLEPVGLLGLSDTLRSDARKLVEDLRGRDLGIRLLTGDHPLTAAAVASELGMSMQPSDVVTGPEWESLSRSERESIVTERTVFARMTPEHKVQVVHALEAGGSVCAMVGDGANDAAAIRAASVGIGVAASDSDPARGAADIVLLDGRVSGLIDALDEGAQLWRRVRSAVGVLLGGNAGEVAFALTGSALSGESPLNARQMLLVNLMTDALPAAALAVSTPTAERQMDSRGSDTDDLWRTITIRGGATALGALSAWILARGTGRRRRASTVALVALVGTQLGQTLIESRSPLVVVTAVGSVAVLGALVSTPVVSQFLGCTPLGPLAWFQAVGCASAATALAAVMPRVVEKLVAAEG